jgi:N-acetylneuraminate lyase
MIESFRGVIPALLSPTDERGGLSVKPLPRLLRFLKEAGCSGFFVGGSSGEGFFLTPPERKRLAEVVVREIGGELPVVIHVGAMDIRVAEELARHAARIGAAGISSVMPFYYGYSLAEARNYYQALATASGLPLIIYVYSGASSIKFTPESFIETMGTVRNLYGLKYTAMTLHEMQAMQQLSGGRLRTYGGWDELALPYLTMGCDGIIGTNYNYMPEPFVAMHRAVRSGELAEAMRQQALTTRALYELASINPVERAKAGCRARGFDLGRARRPMSAASKETLATLKRVLAGLGLGAA